MNLVEAVQQHCLVQWHDRGFVRTVEPHMLALFPGARLVLIGFQIAGGPDGEGELGWKVIDISDGLNVEPTRTFTQTRTVPAHLVTLVQAVYASA